MESVVIHLPRESKAEREKLKAKTGHRGFLMCY